MEYLAATVEMVDTIAANRYSNLQYLKSKIEI